MTDPQPQAASTARDVVLPLVVGVAAILIPVAMLVGAVQVALGGSGTDVLVGGLLALVGAAAFTWVFADVAMDALASVRGYLKGYRS